MIMSPLSPRQFKCEHCNQPLAKDDHFTAEYDDHPDTPEHLRGYVRHADEIGCLSAKERFHRSMVAKGKRPDWDPDLAPGNNA